MSGRTAARVLRCVQLRWKDIVVDVRIVTEASVAKGPECNTLKMATIRMYIGKYSAHTGLNVAIGLCVISNSPLTFRSFAHVVRGR